MSQPMRRFYKQAAAGKLAEAGNAHAVLLDGRPLRTPAKALLAVPTAPLAAAIAEEWADQADVIRPGDMPLTSFVCTAIDRVAADRRAVAEEVAAYAEHDLLCYRVDSPSELAARQQALWQPLLDWVAVTFDAPLAVTRGLDVPPHPAGSLEALRREVERLDPWRLTALSAAVQASGSLVVALALMAGRISAEQAFEAGQLDESFQIERWGEDPEAVRRRSALRDDLAAVARFLELLPA